MKAAWATKPMPIRAIAYQQIVGSWKGGGVPGCGAAAEDEAGPKGVARENGEQEKAKIGVRRQESVAIMAAHEVIARDVQTGKTAGDHGLRGEQLPGVDQEAAELPEQRQNQQHLQRQDETLMRAAQAKPRTACSRRSR